MTIFVVVSTVLYRYRFRQAAFVFTHGTLLTGMVEWWCVCGRGGEKHNNL